MIMDHADGEEDHMHDGKDNDKVDDGLILLFWFWINVSIGIFFLLH